MERAFCRHPDSGLAIGVAVLGELFGHVFFEGPLTEAPSIDWPFTGDTEGRTATRIAQQLLRQRVAAIPALLEEERLP
jgi:hypothetical protein